MKTYQAGIDVGSTTVKLVVLDENGQMIFGQYQRHLSHTQRALSALLKQARAALGECALELRATGSGAINLAKALGIPFAYDHFAEGESPEPPFICYLLPASDNFAADGQVYFKATEVHIELYTDIKDVGLEASVETVLDERSIFYDKSEVWIESERLYEVLYSFEMEV